MLTRQNIIYHFAANRSWKELFERHYPNWTPETYTQDAWKLFSDNGYRYELIRYSNNPNSKVYRAIKSIDLYKGDEFIAGRVQCHEDSAVEQLIIMIVDDHDVDFNTFK